MVETQLAEHKKEPDSGLAKAISYLLNHWSKLTLFLSQPGSPIENNRKLLRVGVTLGDLTSRGTHHPDLFDQPEDAKLTRAIDQVNVRFGKGTIAFGSSAKITGFRHPKSGSSIA